MASDICIHFYFKNDNYSAYDNFCGLTEALSSWDQSEETWQGLEVEKKRSRDFVQNLSLPLSLTVLKHDASRFASGTTERFSTGIGFRCWRFNQGEPKKGYLRAEVESWGPNYETSKLAYSEIEGVAAVSIRHPGPYCALLESETEKTVKDINSYVEENLENLTELLFLMIENLQPNSMKVFVNEGWTLPFNANFAYYRDESFVIEDLEYIAKIWKMGMPRYHNIMPLKKFIPNQHDFCFHTWREEQERREVWKNLTNVLPNLSSVSKKSIAKIIKSGKFDNYEMNPGFCVLEYPHFFNNFLDRFYFEILDTVG